MKKLTSLLLVFIMLFSLTMVASAKEPVYLYVNGKYIKDAVGFIENSRTLVPVRALAEQMNAEVLWIEAERKVILNKPCDKMEYNGTTYENVVATCELVLDTAQIRIKLTQGDKEIFNVLKPLDCNATSIEGRTHIPARFVGYALGYSVEYTLKTTGHTVYYEFIGKQTIDFEVEQIPNQPTEKYPEIMIYEEKPYRYRKGYGDIMIFDTSEGKIENGIFVNLYPYRLTGARTIIESDEKEYEISNDKTMDENLSTFAKFYEDKVGEDVTIKDYSDGDRIYNLEYLTNKSIGIKTVLGTSRDSGTYLYKYLEDIMYYKVVTTAPPIYDYSMWYNLGQSNDGFYGQKFYGTKDDSFLRIGSNKNTLLFLNEFLGETGQRISKMMSDYYTFSGCFSVPNDSQWTKFKEDGFATSFDLIDENAIKYYGLEPDTIFDETAKGVLSIKTDNQKIYIEYTRPNIEYSLDSGYTVVFEKIEK